MIDVIVDHRPFGFADRLLHRMQLLCEIETRPPFLEHLDHATQMAFRAFETLHDFRVAFVQVLAAHRCIPYAEALLIRQKPPEFRRFQLIPYRGISYLGGHVAYSLEQVKALRAHLVAQAERRCDGCGDRAGCEFKGNTAAR